MNRNIVGALGGAIAVAVAYFIFHPGASLLICALILGVIAGTIAAAITR